MNRRIVAWTGGIVFLLLVFGALQYYRNDQRAMPPPRLVLAAETSLLPSTVWVAEKRDLFRAEGIEVAIRDFDSGRNALETMLRDNTVQMATVAQTPVVFNSFNHDDFVIVATMAYSFDDVKILARRDRNIANARDLQGKSVGTTLRSTGHYFLQGFLTHYGLSVSDVELVDTNAADLPNSLVEGGVDAITTWEPHIFNTTKRMGQDDVVLLTSPTPFRKDFYFVVRSSYARDHQATIQKFLKALFNAEQYIRSNPQQAQDIAAERIGADTDLVRSIWKKFTFSISLDQSILVALEDEARWAKESGYTDKNVPNYLDFIYLDAMKVARPSSVTIIH